jgi:hypothetical protein
MIVGVRSKADLPDRFDDAIYLLTPKQFYRFSATTNPGVHWLETFLNPKGTAVLKPGLYWYKIGKHRGYAALVQDSAVTVYRDVNKNRKAEESGEEDTGFFGINIHRANPTRMSTIIGQWSAGCQVLNSPIEFNTLIDECQKSGLSRFPYYLIKES